MHEDYLIKKFRQLTKTNKKSIIDYMEFLISKQTPIQVDSELRETQKIDKIKDFLTSLPPKEFDKMLAVFEGVRIGYTTNEIARKRSSGEPVSEEELNSVLDMQFID